MPDEPEVRNEISGQVFGPSVQAGRIEGGVHFYGHPSAHGVPAAPPEPVLPPRDRWLTWTGIATIIVTLADFVLVPRLLGWPPLFGTGAVLTDVHQFLRVLDVYASDLVALAWAWFLGWQLWTGWDLTTRRRQNHGRERHVGQLALWFSLLPVYAVGASFGSVLPFLLAAGLAVSSLVRSPRALVPHRVAWAATAGLVAASTWLPVEVVTLWSTPAPVAWRIAGLLLLLPIVAVPVHAMLVFPGTQAGCVLRTWLNSLGAKFGVTLLILAIDSSAVLSKTVAIVLPILGMLAMKAVVHVLGERTRGEAA
ncbi:hypothetical protein [Lentzea sp. NPDC059081]|uniref:hypothetical protein n=1 Tax=Lentzea sp. NPDC059081 TaxID=3346719 RepID=UPI0036C2945B